MDPFGWRIAAAVVGCADGPGACAGSYAGSPARPLLGLRRRAAALASTACTSCCPGWRCSTSSSPSSSCAGSTASSRTATGSAEPGWPPGGRAARGPRAAVPAVAAGRRRRLRPRGRHQVDGALPAGRLRPAGLRCGAAGARRSFGVRRRAAARRGPRRGAGLRPPGGGRARRLRGHLERLARPRGGVRGGAQQHAVHDLRGRRRSGRRPPSRTRRAPARSSSRCARSGTTTRTSTRSTPTSSTTATHIYASKPAGWLLHEPAGRRRRAARHPARVAGVRRPRGLHLPAPGAAARQPADLVGRRARAALRGGRAGSAPGTGASGSRWSARGPRGCRG